MKKIFYIQTFVLILVLTPTCFGQDTLAKRDNGFKATISVAGIGIGYENEFMKKTYFDIGVSTFPMWSGAYTHFKYAVKYKDKSKFKIGVGVQAIYVNTLYFHNSEFLVFPMGLMEYEYKGWGFGFGLFLNPNKGARKDLPLAPWLFFCKKFRLHRQ